MVIWIAVIYLSDWFLPPLFSLALFLSPLSSHTLWGCITGCNNLFFAVGALSARVGLLVQSC